MPIPELVKWTWIAIGIFWVLAAFTQKRTVRRQSAGSRLLQMGIVLLAVFPFFSRDPRLLPLQRHFLAVTEATQLCGLLLLWAGCAFAVWARLVLGGNWSGQVTVKENHELTTRGPYALVRHPIYSGLLLALAGTAVAEARAVYLILLPLVLLALWLKAGTEETFMLETFGEPYAAYRKRVKALIPFVL